MYFDDYLIDKNGNSEFVRAIIDQWSIMPLSDSIEGDLEKISRWIERYRYENNITEYLDFPTAKDLE